MTSSNKFFVEAIHENKGIKFKIVTNFKSIFLFIADTLLF